MYSPRYNRLQDRAQLVAFMRQHNFPVLVTGSGGSLRASHLPALVQEEGGELALDMHMARANEQWRHFDDTEALVIFSGPHAYISPRWYEDTERVPTWNYAAVHAYGSSANASGYRVMGYPGGGPNSKPVMYPYSFSYKRALAKERTKKGYLS